MNEIDKASVSSGQSSSKPSSAASGSKWVRFDDSVSTETTISDPSARAIPRGHRVSASPTPKVALAKGQQMILSVNQSAPGADVAQIEVTVEEARPSSSGRSTGQKSASAGPLSSDWENGKLVTQIRPENKHCAWFTAAEFSPYKMPSSLVSDRVNLPVEEYVQTMEMLVNDFRFRSYTMLYRRMIAGWLIFALILLIVLLASLNQVVQGFALFGICLAWVFIVGIGVLGCLMWKKRIHNQLNDCIQWTNQFLTKHHLLIGVDDRGQLSCHKIVLMFIYFKTDDCIREIVRLINATDQQRGHRAVFRESIDLETRSGGRGSQRLLSPEERAQKLILKYSQPYAKALIRRCIKFPSRPLEGVSEFQPLHCSHSLCFCQYIHKNHFDKKPEKWWQTFF